jgi:hypothetical protein
VLKQLTVAGDVTKQVFVHCLGPESGTLEQHVATIEREAKHIQREKRQNRMVTAWMLWISADFQ